MFKHQTQNFVLFCSMKLFVMFQSVYVLIDSAKMTNNYFLTNTVIYYLYQYTLLDHLSVSNIRITPNYLQHILWLGCFNKANWGSKSIITITIILNTDDVTLFSIQKGIKRLIMVGYGSLPNRHLNPPAAQNGGSPLMVPHGWPVVSENFVQQFQIKLQPGFIP